MFASDPEKLAGLEEAEAKADAVLSKLRKQVRGGGGGTLCAACMLWLPAWMARRPSFTARCAARLGLSACAAVHPLAPHRTALHIVVLQSPASIPTPPFCPPVLPQSIPPQVAKLESALQPLQEFLDAELAADEDHAAHISLEERLEADAAARQAAAEAAAEEAAPAPAASSSGASSDSDGSSGAAAGSAPGAAEGGEGSGHGGINGFAAPVRPRSTLPWQQ